MKQQMMGEQKHQLGHMQIICTSLHTDASTPPLSFRGRTPFLSPNQQRQSTEGEVHTIRPVVKPIEQPVGQPRLNVCLHDAAGCSTGCSTGLTTGRIV